GKLAGTARIKVRFGDFSTLTRQMPLHPPLDTDRDLIACAFTLFDREDIIRAVRLIGFGVSRLAEPDRIPPVQGELFADEILPSGPDPRNRKLDLAVDALRKTFGETAVRRGHAGRE
ncbi:MAG: hypothetical protein WCG36_01490, partial [bacterium]